MRRLVIDAGTLLSWFDAAGDGRSMRADYEAGKLTAVAPRSIVADAVGHLAQRSGWTGERLERAATELQRIGLELHDPPVAGLARWIAKGLATDQAAYPALAESLDLRLASADAALRQVAAPLLGD